MVQGRVFDDVSITSQLANDAAVVLVDENDLAVCRALDIVVFTTGSVISWVVLFQRSRGLGWGSTLKESGALCQNSLESIVVLGRDVLVKGDAGEDAAVGT